MAASIRSKVLRGAMTKLPAQKDPYDTYPSHPAGGPSDALMEKSEHPSMHKLMDSLHHKGGR